MDVERINRISPELISDMLNSRGINTHPKQALGQRCEERWPFPATVEVWLPQGAYGEKHMLCTLHNLSLHGLALRTKRPIQTGQRISFALHQPEQSCFGDALVRHCTRAGVGYLVGIEFSFDQASPS